MPLSFSIPLYLFLIIYLVFFAIVAIFVAINIYHIFLSASFHLPSLVITVFVLSSQLLIILVTFYLLRDVSWGETVFTFSLPFSFQ